MTRFVGQSCLRLGVVVKPNHYRVAMLFVTNGWDGVWGSLAGGILSGLTVVIGVYLAQYLSDQRRRSSEERAAADSLLIEVANARDAAVHSRSKARTGRYDLWPLRHQLYLSHALHGRSAHEAVQNYYDAVWALRDWVRHGPVAQGDRSADEPEVARAFLLYQRAIDAWADALIEGLRTPTLALSEVATWGPTRPTLP